MLPKLNDTPKYQEIIPSQGKKIRFRPYLVKEEKVLMLASETGNSVEILNAIGDTVSACIADDIDFKKLTTFDVEYLFLKIRSKSVGETQNVSIKCSECEHGNDYTIDLRKVEIDVPKVNDKIQLTDAISLKMKWPSFIEMSNEPKLQNVKSKTEFAFKYVTMCIDSIMTEDQNISVSDVSQEELDEFIESMNNEQYKMLESYFESMPKLVYNVEFECANCNHTNKYDLSDIKDFF